jgi:hypothetical protein
MPKRRTRATTHQYTPPKPEAGVQEFRHLDTSQPAVPVEVLNFTVRTFVDRPETYSKQATTTHRGGRF